MDYLHNSEGKERRWGERLERRGIVRGWPSHKVKESLFCEEVDCIGIEDISRRRRLNSALRECIFAFSYMLTNTGVAHQKMLLLLNKFIFENWTSFIYTSTFCIFSLNISNTNLVRSVGLFLCYLSEENRMTSYEKCVPMVWPYTWILTFK